MDKNIVILPCAGSGARLGSNLPKQYLLINGKTILEHTLDVFLALSQVDQIIIAVAPNDQYIEKVLNLSDTTAREKITVLRIGGESRTHTVRNVVNFIECNENDWLLVHDVVRCCITEYAITNQIRELASDKIGGILAIPAVDTIKYSRDGACIENTILRNNIFLTQTPQMFRAHVLKKALNRIDPDLITDEASAVEQMNLPVRLVPGERTNIKVTYPTDVKLAEVILNDR